MTQPTPQPQNSKEEEENGLLYKRRIITSLIFVFIWLVSICIFQNILLILSISFFCYYQDRIIKLFYREKAQQKGA